LLKNISYGSLREAFRQIAAGTHGFSTAVDALRKWAGPVGVLIASIFAGLNMYDDTGSSLKGTAAALGTFGLGIIAWVALGFLLPGLGIFTIVIMIAAIVTLTMILQSILMDYIRTTYYQFRRRLYASKYRYKMS
jgi:hypothetical protein